MPQTNEGVLLVIGAGFILIGLLGGGFEISAVKIPPIGRFTRGFTTFVGMFLMLVGLRSLVLPPKPSSNLLAGGVATISSTMLPSPVVPESPTIVPTSVPPTFTPEPPTATVLPPTSTQEPSSTSIPPTMTPEPPTSTPIPPTLTPEPPTSTPIPPSPTMVIPSPIPEVPTPVPSSSENVALPQTNNVPPDIRQQIGVVLGQSYKYQIDAYFYGDASIGANIFAGNALSSLQQDIQQLNQDGIVNIATFHGNYSYVTDVRVVSNTAIEVDSCEYWQNTFYYRQTGVFISATPMNLLPQTQLIQQIGSNWYITDVTFYDAPAFCQQ